MATRMIDGFADKDYNGRLKELGINTLETRLRLLISEYFINRYPICITRILPVTRILYSY